MLNGLSNVYPVVPLAEMAKDLKRDQVREQNVVAKNSSKFVSKNEQQESSREAMREKSDEEELLRRLEAKRQQIEISERQKKEQERQNKKNAGNDDEEESNDEQQMSSGEEDTADKTSEPKMPFYRSPRIHKQAINAYTFIEKHPTLPQAPEKDLTV